MQVFARAALVLFLHFASASADMLAPTPQTGFNNWYSTFCRADFNEEMIRGVADKLITLDRVCRG